MDAGRRNRARGWQPRGAPAAWRAVIDPSPRGGRRGHSGGGLQPPGDGKQRRQAPRVRLCKQVELGTRGHVGPHRDAGSASGVAGDVDALGTRGVHHAGRTRGARPRSRHGACPAEAKLAQCFACGSCSQQASFNANYRISPDDFTLMSELRTTRHGAGPTAAGCRASMQIASRAPLRLPRITRQCTRFQVPFSPSNPLILRFDRRRTTKYGATAAGLPRPCDGSQIDQRTSGRCSASPCSRRGAPGACSGACARVQLREGRGAGGGARGAAPGPRGETASVGCRHWLSCAAAAGARAVGDVRADRRPEPVLG